jgi:hypothetical protein
MVVEAHRFMPSKEPSGHPQVQQAQKRLADALSEACLDDPTDANTGELIKVEEVLAIANEAAKEAISLRRRIRHDEQRGGGKAEDGAVATSTVAEGFSTTAHRVFDDAGGVRWNAFAVYPTQMPKGRATLPDKFRDGWLSFNSDTETRRIAPVPSGWSELSDDGLRQLCDQAEVARRLTSREGPSAPSREGPSAP